MKNEIPDAVVAFLIIFFGLAGVSIGYTFCARGGEDVRREAVKLGHAEYVAGKNGEPEFHWRPIVEKTLEANK